ncbi:hypothetical protein M9458_047997, partial [Cirrhinus mrigala]
NRDAETSFTLLRTSQITRVRIWPKVMISCREMAVPPLASPVVLLWNRQGPETKQVS